jgi:hypothetical protein
MFLAGPQSKPARRATPHVGEEPAHGGCPDVVEHVTGARDDLSRFAVTGVPQEREPAAADPDQQLVERDEPGGAGVSGDPHSHLVLPDQRSQHDIRGAHPLRQIDQLG